MYNSCVKGTMLFSSECWPLRQDDWSVVKEQCSYGWMCNNKKTACQHKFPPKSSKTEKPGFSVKV